MRRYLVPGRWSVDVPDGWHVTEHPECTTFEPQSGESAFQVSAHHKDGNVTDDDLREFAGGGRLTPIVLPHFTGFESTSTEQQVFARKLWLPAGPFLIFATYIFPVGTRR